MIDFDKVTKKFSDDTLALDEVSFVVDPGEFVFITGPSGAGKTTLGRLMIGEMFPTSGSLRVGDYNLMDLDKRELPALRRQIGFVFQDFKLLPDRTAAENIALSLEILDKSMDEVYERVSELLKLVGLGGKGNLFPNQLSGGEVQRTVIARAIASEPAVLFADEPTGNLDIVTTTAIVDLLEEINKTGTTIMMATHDEDLVQAANKRQIKFENGKVLFDSKAKVEDNQTAEKTSDVAEKEDSGDDDKKDKKKKGKK